MSCAVTRLCSASSSRSALTLQHPARTTTRRNSTSGSGAGSACTGTTTSAAANTHPTTCKVVHSTTCQVTGATSRTSPCNGANASHRRLSSSSSRPPLQNWNRHNQHHHRPQQRKLLGMATTAAAASLVIGSTVLDTDDTYSSSSSSPSSCQASSPPTSTGLMMNQHHPYPLFLSHDLRSLWNKLQLQKSNDMNNPRDDDGDDDTNLSKFEQTATSTVTTSSTASKMINVVEALEKTVRKITYPSHKHYDVSVRAIKGGRLSMEDKYCVHNGGRFSAVFDGHGGGGVSKYLSETLFDTINHHLKTDSNEPEKLNLSSNADKENLNIPTSSSINTITKAITAAFIDIDEDILSVDDYQYQGSTAVAVWVHEDDQDDGTTGHHGRTLVSANIGDSRAILSKNCQAIDLTRDHKPNDDMEKKRILSLGETVEWDPYANVYRVQNLSLSRAIGDRFAKPVVSSEVDIKLFPLKDEGDDDFIVLASDGLWDVMTSQDCVDYVNNRLSPSKEQAKNISSLEMTRLKYSRRKNMSRFVANEALRRGSCDNVCVIIVWLNDLS